METAKTEDRKGVHLVILSQRVLHFAERRPLTKGKKAKAVLTFEHAPPLTVEFSIERVGASGPGAVKGGDMGGMKM